MSREELVIPFAQVRLEDVNRVGGKNASLGELLRSLGARGIRVPDGLAITAAVTANTSLSVRPTAGSPPPWPVSTSGT